MMMQLAMRNLRATTAMGAVVLFWGLFLLGIAPRLAAQPLAVQGASITGIGVQGNCFCGENGLFGDKKKKKKRDKANFLAVGAVIGDPVGFGGRVVVRPARLAVAGDIAYNRIRTDQGLLISAMVLKADARYYSKGFIAKLLRPYTFAGVTMQRGKFDEERMESVLAADAGIGAGIKLWHLEINGEVGILVPFKQSDVYKPGLGAFANIGILFWLM